MTQIRLLSRTQPIGIFDSGIGGLTVASAIAKLLPEEKLIYFGDTAHLPYGDKSGEAIKRYSIAIAKHFEERGCKVILIACNTASARAYSTLVKAYSQRLIVMDVITPVATHVAAHYHGAKVGVIGTKGTIASRIYPRTIKKLNADVRVRTAATPLLAPMIEEGFFNNNISRAVVNSYLSKKELSDIDALVLGCTHYPLIRNEIDHFYRGHLPIIDSASCAATFLRDILRDNGLLCDRRLGEHEFFVSDYTDSFARSTEIFFGDKVDLRSNGMWNITSL